MELLETRQKREKIADIMIEYLGRITSDDYDGYDGDVEERALIPAILHEMNILLSNDRKEG